MITAVIFDIGGVLQIWQDHPMHQDIKETLGISDAVFATVYPPLVREFRKGTLSEKEFWAQFIKQTKTQKSLPEESLFLRTYKNLFTTDKEVLSIIHTLKDNGYALAAVTNSNPAHTAYNRAQGLYDIFPIQIVSDEVGFVKPEKEIFHIALKKLVIQPEEAVFIDDLAENIAAAHQVGMNGIWYKNATQLREDLKALHVTL